METSAGSLQGLCTSTTLSKHMQTTLSAGIRASIANSHQHIPLPPLHAGPRWCASSSYTSKLILYFNLHVSFFFRTKWKGTIFRFTKPKDVLAAKLHQEERTNTLSFGLITELIITLFYMQRNPCLFICNNRMTHADIHMKGLNISSCQYFNREYYILKIPTKLFTSIKCTNAFLVIFCFPLTSPAIFTLWFSGK